MVGKHVGRRQRGLPHLPARRDNAIVDQHRRHARHPRGHACRHPLGRHEALCGVAPVRGRRTERAVWLPEYLYRFSYSSSTKTYTLDTGFPVQINNMRTETLVIDKDSTGKLWATWSQDSTIFVIAR